MRVSLLLYYLLTRYSLVIPSVIFPLVNIQAVAVSLRALAKFQTQPATCTSKSELFSSCTFKSELSSKCLSIPSYPQQVPPPLKYPQQVVSIPSCLQRASSMLSSFRDVPNEYIHTEPNPCCPQRVLQIQAAASISNGLPSQVQRCIELDAHVPRRTQTRCPRAETHSN